MSSYKKLTKHPETKQFELATWIDNHFGEHNYGIIFDSSPNVIHDSRDEEFETKELCNECGKEIHESWVTYANNGCLCNLQDPIIKQIIAKIKLRIEANTENNMISLEARLAVDKELNELLEEIK
jgi:hypothetical protein